jgi:hypothetical protein
MRTQPKQTSLLTESLKQLHIFLSSLLEESKRNKADFDESTLNHQIGQVMLRLEPYQDSFKATV